MNDLSYLILEYRNFEGNINANAIGIFDIMLKKMLKYILLIVLMTNAVVLSAQIPSAENILKKAIQYHDPENQWSRFSHEMTFVSERPDGPDRNSVVTIDNNRGFFSLKENNNDMEIVMEDCKVIPDGKTCDQVKRTRNYYLYLWGLPMKLMDKGTTLSSRVKEQKFNERDCYVLRVDYDQDVWFYYIDKSSNAMIGYMFYKDEPNQKGEVIYLDGEVKIDQMRIPKTRKWYTTPDNKFLGTDILISSK